MLESGIGVKLCKGLYCVSYCAMRTKSKLFSSRNSAKKREAFNMLEVIRVRKSGTIFCIATSSALVRVLVEGPVRTTHVPAKHLRLLSEHLVSLYRQVGAVLRSASALIPRAPAPVACTARSSTVCIKCLTRALHVVKMPANAF